MGLDCPIASEHDSVNVKLVMLLALALMLVGYVN
jgi:hypothetical protein